MRQCSACLARNFADSAAESDLRQSGAGYGPNWNKKFSEDFMDRISYPDRISADYGDWQARGSLIKRLYDADKLLFLKLES